MHSLLNYYYYYYYLKGLDVAFHTVLIKHTALAVFEKNNDQQFNLL